MSRQYGTLYPLGIGGRMATSERETASYLWETDGKLILLDAGSGLRRLSDPALRKLVADHQRIYLFLSHYHLDHTIGLTYIEQFLRPDQTLVICGPDRFLAYYRVEEALESFLRMPLHSTPYPALPFQTEIRELSLGENQIDDLSVTVWPQPHSDSSIGFAFGSTLAYCTDTTTLNRALTPCNGVRYLLHDVFYDATDLAELQKQNREREIQWHSLDTDAAEFALQCGAFHLIPIHFHPLHDAARTAAQIERISDIFVDTIVPVEGVPIAL